MTTLYDIKQGALESLRESIESTGDYDDDTLHEIADSSVPVYNQDILEAALDDMDLALTEPEIGPAFDGSSTAINIIAANIYEAILEFLTENADRLLEEYEDGLLEDEDEDEDEDD